MSKRSNNQEYDETQPFFYVEQNEDKDTEVDKCGIYDTTKKDFKYFFALKRISHHLNQINKTLESLDHELVEYRKVKKTCIVHDDADQSDLDTRLWWTRSIQNEMRIFHYNASYCLKMICHDFCSKSEEEHFV